MHAGCVCVRCGPVRGSGGSCGGGGGGGCGRAGRGVMRQAFVNLLNASFKITKKKKKPEFEKKNLLIHSHEVVFPDTVSQ